MSGAAPIVRASPSTSRDPLAASAAPASTVGDPGSWRRLPAASSGQAVVLPPVPGFVTETVPPSSASVATVA